MINACKRLAKRVLPSFVVESVRSAWFGPSHHSVLEYAPQGWRTVLASGSGNGWDTAGMVAVEEARWKAFVKNCEGTGPLGFSHEYHNPGLVRDVAFHNVHLSYAYTLALAARQKSAISVLDWGGGLGHYYLMAKAVLPGLAVEFHCKEVPLMVATGRRLNPEVHWHIDERCLDRTYDVIMINGSLQYMQDWADLLRRIAPAVGGYLFLTRLPVVDRTPSFVSIQRVEGTELLHQQLNQQEVLDVVRGTGLQMVREFVVGDRPFIKNAPEQCELRGWLFKRQGV